jgi:TonB family protein
MLKTLLLFVFGLLIFERAEAQKKDTLVYFMKNSGAVTPRREDADYIRFILPADSTDKNSFPVLEFYANGKRKLIASVRGSSNNRKLDGPAMSFFANGQRQSVVNYKNGFRTGDVTLYYPNGKIYATKKYDKHDNLLFLTLRDSTGNILVENGNGHWMDYNDDLTALIKEGTVINGLPNGEWNGPSGKIFYDKGRVVSTTINVSPPPNYFDIQLLEEAKLPRILDAYPSYGDKKTNLDSVIKANTHYPAIDQENNIMGNVYIGFIIEPNGSLSNLKILRSPSRTMGEEAERVIKSLGQWNPGMIKNKAVRAPLVVSVNFDLDTLQAEDKKVYRITDTQPFFSPDMRSFYSYVARVVRYPALEKETHITGKVFLTFLVEKNGSISHARFISAPSMGLGEEAVKTMMNSPAWNPALIKGVPVRSQYTIPIVFTLGE